MPPPAPPPREAVFTIVFEATAKDGGLSASSNLRVAYVPSSRLAAGIGMLRPGRDGKLEDSRTPAALYKTRGGLLGLQAGELLTFGVLRHSGVTRSKAYTQTGPSGVESPLNWTVEADVADFRRTATGGVLTFHPPMYMTDMDDGIPLLTPNTFYDEADRRKYRELVTFRLTNEDLKSWNTFVRVHEASLMNGQIQQTFKATLMGGDPGRSDVEVAVEPEAGYDRWLPEGTLDDPEVPGKRLHVRIRVSRVGDLGSSARVRLAVSIPHTSEEKGVCLNWPAAARSGKGLRFAEKDFPAGGELAWKGPGLVESAEAVDGADLVVSSYDFGAWGTLRVTATGEDGRPARVKVRGKETPDLAVPLDDNGNRVADAWEEQEGVLGKTAGADDEETPPHKPGCPGDGLGLYEEYRGFRVDGGHQRLSPRVLDVFVCDDTTEKVAAFGIDAFEHATKLKVRRIRREEMDSNRVVNFNGSASTQVVLQHAILVLDGYPDSSPAAVPEDESKWGPPRWTKHILLPQGVTYDWEPAPTGPKTRSRNIADVAHELTHAVGVRHHGREPQAVLWRWKDDFELVEQEVTGDSDSSPDKLGVRGTAVPIEAFWEPRSAGESPRSWVRHDRVPDGFLWVERLGGWVLYRAGKRGASAGDAFCVMRYEDRGVYVPYEGRNLRFIPDKLPFDKRTRLCTDGRGTGANDPGHFPVSRYGDASRGNCVGQVVISDRHPPVPNTEDP